MTKMTEHVPINVPPPVGEAMVAPIFLAPIISEALRKKVDLQALFRGLAMDSADFDVPGTLVSQREAITVVRRALPLLAIDGAGLELSSQTRVTERGVLALGLLGAATLGEAIDLSLRFPQSAGYLLQVRGVSSPTGHQTILEPYPGDQDLQRLLVDLTFATMLKLRRQVTAANYSPSIVEFVSAAPTNAAAYLAFFGCPVRFGCLKNVLSTDAKWLAFPLPWASAMAYRLSSQLLERERERMNAMPAMGFTIERAIRRGLPHVADIAQLAASLHLSERTLRRKLTKEGLSYRMVLDEIRRSRAFDLMAAGHRPIAQIALDVGFSDVRAFSRAFKRWTGYPPTQIKGRLNAVGSDRSIEMG
jgi:AraC-like DNA-binding protein